MRLTKHEHAALLLEHEGKGLIIDPGSFTTPFPEMGHVVAVVVTHEHADHWTPEHLDRIRKAAPGVPIYGPAGVEAAASDHGITVVEPGDTVTIEPFTLRFFPAEHEVIHESLPRVQNVGVLVNDQLYYPGDSYAVPEGVDVNVLAAPIGAPWLRIGDAMDFVLAVKPRRAFGTHDMTLSVIGRDMHRARLQWATAQNGGEFLALDPGDTMDI
ncbi:MBL fold metallo-hydrolase [Microbacterium limosum]|uniref:MBL fold metallo-hydrolase n=1 Tax=Microbacterium limosum TaxID=3079935 RepID=A0AAU0MDP6_9MICO|nr:MBL fold metallo-hydrolase [Microbacterium sp. Y20]WOQ68542.1 MBL fold metallo-hydrolase [Microbacterium sp. Y20]